MFTGTNMPGVISRNQSISKLLFKMCVCSVAQLFVMSWAVARQAPLSMGFPKQEYWSAVAISYSRGASQPRDGTRVSCIWGIPCIGRRILHHRHRRRPSSLTYCSPITMELTWVIIKCVWGFFLYIAY